MLVEDQIPAFQVNDIASTRDGAIWIATDQGLITTEGMTWRYIDKDNGLPWNYVNLVEVAPDGSLWASFGNKLAHLVDGTWVQAKIGNAGIISDLVIDDRGEVWINAESVYHFDGKKWLDHVNSGVYSSKEMAYSQTTGMWFLYKALANYTYPKWTYVNLGNGYYDYRAITAAPNGKIWLAVDDPDPTSGYPSYLRSYDGTFWVDRLPTDAKEINDLQVDKSGSIWVAAENGAFTYDGKKWTHFTTKDGLAGNRVKQIHLADDGSVWFITDGGLTRYDNP
jgi:ligand-binding sensor domain-containing protein